MFSESYSGFKIRALSSPNFTYLFWTAENEAKVEELGITHVVSDRSFTCRNGFPPIDHCTLH
jgi:hypothetical protein